LGRHAIWSDAQRKISAPDAGVLRPADSFTFGLQDNVPVLVYSETARLKAFDARIVWWSANEDIAGLAGHLTCAGHWLSLRLPNARTHSQQ
jgi:hypothetical protein